MGATTFARQLEGWSLFAWIVGLTSIAVVLLATTVDLSTGPGTVSMIRTSVRLSAPWVILAFAASSLLTLFPNEQTRWLMRNRRIFGLCFAAIMGWQLVFIIWMFVAHAGFYWETIHTDGDLLGRIIAYMILLAMTLTSFATPRRRIGPRAWLVLHKIGIYAMWLAIWTSYTEIVFVEQTPPAIAYIYAATGLAAWMLRVAAFAQKSVSAPEPHHRQLRRNPSPSPISTEQ
jgi:sulfoxide reductase heme-binding subunit YedZ